MRRGSPLAVADYDCDDGDGDEGDDDDACCGYFAHTLAITIAAHVAFASVIYLSL